MANTGAPLDAAGVSALAALRASAKRDDARSVGRFGVGFAAVLALSDAPRVVTVHGDPEPAPDTRGPRGVSGVLRELDAPRVRVSPEPQVLLGVRVFPEPGGRVGPGGENAGPKRSRTERIAAEVGRHREPAGSSSSPSS